MSHHAGITNDASNGAIGSGRSPSAQRTRHPPNATRRCRGIRGRRRDPPRRATSRARSRRRRCGVPGWRSFATSDRGVSRPAAHSRYPMPASATSAATRPPIEARTTHVAAWRASSTPPTLATAEPATFAGDRSRRSVTNALPMASVAPRVRSAASTATNPAGNDSAGAGPAPSPASARPDATVASAASNRPRPSESRAAPRRASRNPGWIIFCTAAYAERSSIRTVQRCSLGNSPMRRARIAMPSCEMNG